MARKSTPKVNVQALFDGLPPAGQHFVLAAIDLAVSEAEGQVTPAPAARKPSTRKPKADTPKDDGQWVVGCRFTYLNAKGAASQHRITDDSHKDFVLARSLRKGSQPRQWKRTTLAAMLQTGNVVVK
jgi:invasion protein IalB